MSRQHSTDSEITHVVIMQHWERLLAIPVLCRSIHLSRDTGLDRTPALLQGALDATGACCDGIVDNFGVCDGYDASGIFQVVLAEGSSITVLTAALGLSSSEVSTATE